MSWYNPIVAATLISMGLPASDHVVCWAFSTIAPVAYRPTQFKAHRSPPLAKKQLARTNPLTHRWNHKTALLASSSSSNKTKPPPIPQTDDPFLLLGLDSPTTDKSVIKRAYRKRAMQYHPDVTCGVDSTEKERDIASKDFARINAAYEMLTGGVKGNAATGTSSDGAKSSSGGYGYQPPHRRTSSYSGGQSTNWEDFMPKYDEEDSKYDADGDSFGSIFSDILTGAAGYAAGAAGGGGGVVGDFVEFLERNVDGFESGYDDDKSLSQLLMYGSFDDVASEMDETDVLVTSLETKLSTVENELMQVQADLNLATKFSEKLDFEERVAELKAREKVVKGYVKKGKKRLIRLRERYKELMVEGRGGRGYGGGSGSSTTGRSTSSGDSSYSSSSGSSSSSSSSGYSSNARAPVPAPPASSTTSQSSPAPSPTPASSSSKSWRNEGFSSSYGSRSSSSRRGGRRNRGATTENEAQPNQQQQQQQQRPDENVDSSSSNRGGSYANSSSDRSSSNASSSSSYNSQNTGKPIPQKYEEWVPPHRRTQSTADRVAQDKKRLRELKVDDDFDKLKREMGM